VSARPGTREDDGPELRFGFTYEHVQALAWSAVRKHARSAGMDASDRFEAAHFAVVECLYTAQEPVTSLDLFLAGVRGLNRLRQGDLRERGFASRGPVSRDPAAGPWSARSAWRYWHQPQPTGLAEKATDRVALEQVMATLTRSQALALLALAEHDGDHQAVATALGITRRVLERRLDRARAAFLAAWREHEAPPRRWRRDPGACRRVMRSRPKDRADAARTLADLAAAFRGETRVAGAELLPRLKAADPGRYGDWDARDVGWFLREHQIGRHGVTVTVDGRPAKRWGRRLEDVTAVLQDATAPGPPAAQAARPVAA
jgi:DNA-directed RNA polymerase specialized sigma24 family protein